MYNDIKLTADIVLCGFVEKFHKLVTSSCYCGQFSATAACSVYCKVNPQ